MQQQLVLSTSLAASKKKNTIGYINERQVYDSTYGRNKLFEVKYDVEKLIQSRACHWSKDNRGRELIAAFTGTDSIGSSDCAHRVSQARITERVAS